MPSNLRDYMSKNNISNSTSKQRNEFREGESSMYDKSYVNKPRTQNNSQPFRQEKPRKFMSSKSQCADELNRILDDLNQRDSELKRVTQNYNQNLLKKFNQEYDKLSQQIIRQVEASLKQNKENILRQVKQRRSTEMAETRPIKRNIQQLKEEITGLKDGLYRDSQYREYISRIVLKDYDGEIDRVQADINRIRFPTVDLRLDEKYYKCFKSDTNKIIVVRDQMMSRFGSESFAPKSNYPNKEYPNKAPSSISSSSHHQPSKMQQINPHENRDQIKRSTTRKM